MWLIGKLRPDFRTIANFRKDNKTAIRKVFKEFNRFCYKMDLFSHEGISIDGSKFNAVNAKDNNFTQSKLDDRLERIDGHIKEYLSELDAADLDDRRQRRSGRSFLGTGNGRKSTKIYRKGCRMKMFVRFR